MYTITLYTLSCMQCTLCVAYHRWLWYIVDDSFQYLISASNCVHVPERMIYCVILACLGPGSGEAITLHGSGLFRAWVRESYLSSYISISRATQDVKGRSALMWILPHHTYVAKVNTWILSEDLYIAETSPTESRIPIAGVVDRCAINTPSRLTKWPSTDRAMGIPAL